MSFNSSSRVAAVATEAVAGKSKTAAKGSAVRAGSSRYFI